MSLIFIGVIKNTHGINGAMFFEPSPDTPEYLPQNTRINIGYSSAYSAPHNIHTWIYSTEKVIFSIIGYSSPESAKSMIDKAVYIDKALAKIIYKEEYSISDIVGCNVVNSITKQRYGAISDVWKMPANDVWVISDGSTEYALPVVDEFINSVNIQAKIVEVSLPAGFFDAIEE